jgi:hypothetical protein
MSKRFTETEKWRDPWFRKLTPAQKLLWFYLLDNCDQSGVIDFDHEFAEFQIGIKSSAKDVAALSKQLLKLPSGKLWLHKFVRYQYGKLSHDCKPHKPVFAALEKHGISLEEVFKERLSMPITEGFQSLQDNTKTKTKQEMEQEMEKEKANADAGEAIYSAYPRKVAPVDALKAIAKAIAKGKTPAHLLERTTAYAAATALWPEDELRFIPHPATWFNGGRYDDDPKSWLSNGAPRSEYADAFDDDYQQHPTSNNPTTK